MSKKNRKNNEKSKNDWWARGFGIAGIIFAGFSLYFQFFNNKHDFYANIRNTYIIPDSTIFELVLINDGDYNEIIKNGGFVFVPTKSNIRHNEHSYLLENIEIGKGVRKLIKLKYQTYSKRNIWQLGLSEIDTSNIDIYFYLITIDDNGREYKCETKIGYMNKNFDYIDNTPILIDLIDPDKTCKLKD